MIEPTAPESLATRTARRLDEAAARDHYYRTYAYAKAEFPQTTVAARERVTMDILMDQAAAEDAAR